MDRYQIRLSKEKNAFVRLINLKFYVSLYFFYICPQLNFYYMKNIYTALFVIFTAFSLFSQNNRWDTLFTISNAPNDTVFTTFVNGNNIFIGGAFDSVANIEANHIAYFNGTSWQTLGTGVNGNIYSIIKTDTLLIVGGSFSLAGGIPVQNIAFWNGTIWSSIPAGCNGTIKAFEFYNNCLYVGGDFDTIGGIPANHIARYNGEWDSLGSGTNGPVYSIHYGISLFVGGNFTSAGGVPANNIASWNGTDWSAFGNGFDGPVYSIDGMGGLFSITAAGNFKNSGPTVVNNIARWDGSLWNPLNTGTDSTIYNIKYIGTSTFASGLFTTAGSVNANYIAQWNGFNWTTLGNGLNNTGYSLSNSGYDLICGGAFDSAGLNSSFFVGRYYSPPVIVQQPYNITKCEGDTLLLYIQATSSLPVTFQWYKDSVLIVSSNNDTLIIDSVLTSDIGIYTCLLTNSVGDTTSYPITVTINQSPVFLSILTDTIVCMGTSVNFPVTFTGTSPVSLQWFKNSVAITGETNDTLTFSPANSTDNGTYFCVAQNDCGTDTTNAFLFKINTNPTVSFTGLSAEYCTNGTNDTLYGNPSGGFFSGNGILDSLYFSPFGLIGNQIITYSYTDANGCTGTSSQSTLVNNLSFVTFTGMDSSYCFNDISDTLTGTPAGGVFSGIGMNDSIFSPQSVGSGNHTVYYAYTDTNGCTNTQSQSTTLFGETIFTYFALDTSFCINDSPDTIQVYPYGGFFTGNGMTDSTFSPQSAGIGIHQIIYHYSDSHSCANLDTISVSVHSLPIATITHILSEYCKNAIPDSLTGTPTGGIFTGSYISNNVLDPSAYLPGSYYAYYTYTDSYGCSDSDTGSFLILSAETAYFTGISTSHCPYDSPDTLTGVPAGGTFSGPGITGNIFSPSITGSGIQTIVYTYDNLNGCFSYDSVDVTVFTLPDVNIYQDTTIIQDITTCAGDTIALSAIGDAGYYVWNTLDTTLNISVNPTSTTNYSVTLYTSTCNNSDTVTIIVNPLPVLNLTDTSVCLPFVIQAPGGFASYEWSTGETDSLISITSTGTYSLTVTTSFNCVSSDSILVNILPLPIFDLGQDLSINTLQTIIIGTSPSFSSYLWNTESTQNFIIVSGSVAGFGLHQYWLMVYNDSGCSFTDTILVNISSVGISEGTENGKISFYPNPAHDLLIVSVPQTVGNLFNITISNESGKKVYEINKHSFSGDEIKVDVSNFAKGIYFINFIFKKYSQTHKLLIN
ncbi:MAG: hypothetical protein COX07_08565 [Bacteroidetes bacterium CG23_combo_of_CG06-09_8_20_14_all_32_9]|nr:MAG: hypothetical protein COX07_08565 [Bacteroidetes bacterium CG23_combo_of_CG06-09_8_20_14_all_32_9]